MKPPPNNTQHFKARPFLDGYPGCGRVKFDREHEILALGCRYGEENGVAVEKTLRFTELVRPRWEIELTDNLRRG